MLLDDAMTPPPKGTVHTRMRKRGTNRGSAHKELVTTAPWVTAVTSSRNPARFLPQAIAHRGYKALFPENSMGAFEGAVSVGAHAVETDLHMSSDGVVVLSHVSHHHQLGYMWKKRKSKKDLWRLMYVTGPQSEEVLWRGQEDPRLHVGVPLRS